MKSREAIAEMMGHTGTTGYALSRAIGRSGGYVAAVLAQNGDIGVEKLASMAEAMGYRLVLVSADGKKIVVGTEEVRHAERVDDSRDSRRRL